jgi:hypothetical protein
MLAINAPSGRKFHPLARDQLLVVPEAAPQQQLTEGGDSLSREVQSVEPEGGTASHSVPLGVVDAHRGEKPLVEALRKIAADDLFCGRHPRRVPDPEPLIKSADHNSDDNSYDRSCSADSQWPVIPEAHRTTVCIGGRDENFPI